MITQGTANQGPFSPRTLIFYPSDQGVKFSTKNPALLKRGTDPSPSKSKDDVTFVNVDDQAESSDMRVDGSSTEDDDDIFSIDAVPVGSEPKDRNSDDDEEDVFGSDLNGNADDEAPSGNSKGRNFFDLPEKVTRCQRQMQRTAGLERYPKFWKT